MTGLIGKKIGMTSLFDENGKNIPCTVVLVEPNVVSQVKTIENDGYTAIQIGTGERKEKHSTKALTGHFKKAGTTPKRKSTELRGESSVVVGQSLNAADIFNEGDYVDVVGTSKGKGFQGVVKRHGFAGVGESTHGQHNRARHPGSIGACSTPSRVFKGMRMAGQTGNRRALVQNLVVMKIDVGNNLLVLKGAVPGAKGSYVIVEK